MRVVYQGAAGQRLSYADWRAQVLRSQTVFPEIRYIPDFKSKSNRPLSAAQGSFFNSGENSGSQRKRKTPRPDQIGDQNAA